MRLVEEQQHRAYDVSKGRLTQKQLEEQQQLQIDDRSIAAKEAKENEEQLAHSWNSNCRHCEGSLWS